MNINLVSKTPFDPWSVKQFTECSSPAFTVSFHSPIRKTQESELAAMLLKQSALLILGDFSRVEVAHEFYLSG